MQYCPHCMTPAASNTCPSCGKPVFWQAPLSQLPVGTVLRGSNGRMYQIGAAKGQGGFGITYAAMDLRSNSRVAVKEYYPSRCASRDRMTQVIWATGQEESYRSGMRSFLDEAKMLSAVGALDSVVSVRDYFEGNGTAYIVMEYVDGSPLYEIVQRQGRMTREQLFPILKPLMDDLAILHRAGVIHRDISPDNLILTAAGKLKLLDFGSARSMETGKTMTVMLKAGFSPLEQYQSKGQGAYTDIYALAATIYYCLTGTIPPTSIDRICEDELLPPNDLGARLTQQEQDALLWAMSIHADQRPQNVDAFAVPLLGIAARPQTATRQTQQQTAGYQSQPAQQPQTVYQTSGGYQTQTGYQSQTNYQPQPPQPPRKSGFGKGLFIGIGAAAAAVVVLVATLLLTGVIGGSSGGGEKIRDKGDEPVATAPRVDPSQLETTRPAPPAAEKTSTDGFTYYLSGGEAVITGYTGGEDFVSFPDELEGCTVTVLEAGCLMGNTQVRTVRLPMYCEEIRENAFAGCTGLQDITVYSTIYPDPTAFSGCGSLRALLHWESDPVDHWVLPKSCRTYLAGSDIGIGELIMVKTDDQGVTYGFPANEACAVIDIPEYMSYVEVPESFYGAEVLWISEGAMDRAPRELTVYMCPNMGFDPSLLNMADWDCADTADFCYNWYFTCVICEQTNSTLQGRQVVPDRKVVEACAIRARELEQHYDHDIRPDGTGTADLMDSMEVDWIAAAPWHGKVPFATLKEDLKQAILDMAEVFSGTTSGGETFDALGAGLWFSDADQTVYIYSFGTVWSTAP